MTAEIKVKGDKIIRVELYDCRKFYWSRDNDPWYIVGYMTDDKQQLVTVKSWNKYKQRWVYATEYIQNFIYELYLCNQLKRSPMEWRENDYYIEANKSKC